MVPCHSMLMWSVPSIAVLIGIFWFRKKREFAKSDPGGRERIKTLQEELAEALKAEIDVNRASPLSRAERSVIKSAPIDIVPQGSCSQRSSPLELTDEDIDLEIEKIIRKKSLDKEKRASFTGSQNKIMSVSAKQASFIVKEQISFIKSDMECIVNDLYNSVINSLKDLANIEMTKQMSESFNGTQSSRTRLESPLSEANTTKERTKADTEELRTNNNLNDLPSDSSHNDNDKFSTAPARCISERDSANHSPVDPMLASPSMCHFSDNHSEDLANIEMTKQMSESFNGTQSSRTRLESPLSEANTTKERTKADTEELRTNNNLNDLPSDSSHNDNDKFSTAPARCISERDSANHSPVDPMLASPSMCHFSDNHSEGSSDRGKGCSEAEAGGRERIKTLQEELAKALKAEIDANRASPLSRAERSVIKSAPIDIVPQGSCSQQSSPLELTDEDIDLEIEKILRKKCFQGSSDRGKGCSEAEAGGRERIKTLQEELAEALKAEIDANRASPLSRAERSVIKSAPIDIVPQGSCSQQSSPLELTDEDIDLEIEKILRKKCFQGSSDRGKGCSEVASPPPAGMNIVPSEAGLRRHQFVISQALVGQLMGKQGSFVTQIKAKTGASVYVRRHPDSVNQKICAVEGTQSEIEAALDMITEKFPEKRFPNFSLQEISAELYQRLVPLIPEFLQLQLVDDTVMTFLVSEGYFFLQQPLHPTFPSLPELHRVMAATYQNPDVPALPRPVKEGLICAAPTENNWYRAQVISTSESEELDTSLVKLVDFGGYLTVDNDQLKQIRSDFMTLPFQATETLLTFKPANN